MTNLTPCLSITATAPDVTFKLYLLNPGEHMPGFGGSRAGLTVTGKTASLVVRQTYASGRTVDTEYDIADPRVWSAVAGWVNDQSITAMARAVECAA